MKLRNTLLAMFALLTFASCDLFEDEENEIVTIIEMIVASETIEKTMYKYLDGDETYLEEFLNVNVRGSSRWTEFGLFEIEGFKFDDGYEYSLRVKQTEFLDPPLDGANVKYELEKVLSKTHVNRGIVKVERYWIGENIATVRGNRLLGQEIEDIENDILYHMSPPNTYKSYKFIYTDMVHPVGRVVVYMDNRKEVGIFSREDVQGGYKFYIEIAQNRYEYILRQYISRANIVEPYAFIEDVTSVYKPRFNFLELALAQQIISYYE